MKNSEKILNLSEIATDTMTVETLNGLPYDAVIAMFTEGKTPQLAEEKEIVKTQNSDKEVNKTLTAFERIVKNFTQKSYSGFDRTNIDFFGEQPKGVDEYYQSPEDVKRSTKGGFTWTDILGVSWRGKDGNWNNKTFSIIKDVQHKDGFSPDLLQWFEDIEKLEASAKSDNHVTPAEQIEVRAEDSGNLFARVGHNFIELMKHKAGKQVENFSIRHMKRQIQRKSDQALRTFSNCKVIPS